MPTKTYRLLPIFVPLIIHNLTSAAYSPNGFHKLSWPGLELATPRWESQHSNHAATLTCYTHILLLLLLLLWWKGFLVQALKQSRRILRRIFYTPELTARLYTSFTLCLLLLTPLTYWHTAITAYRRGVCNWHYIKILFNLRGFSPLCNIVHSSEYPLSDLYLFILTYTYSFDILIKASSMSGCLAIQYCLASLERVIYSRRILKKVRNYSIISVWI